MQLIFRQATAADHPDMVRVVAEARRFMAGQGLTQWQDGTPTPAQLWEDIENGEGYVLRAGGALAATAALLLRDEPDYAVIHEGAWGHAGPYAALHRFALADAWRGGGLAGRFFARLQGVCAAAGLPAMRVDTHRHNAPMQRFLQKQGFVRRGVIYLAYDGDERIAFEKLLEPAGK